MVKAISMDRYRFLPILVKKEDGTDCRPTICLTERREAGASDFPAAYLTPSPTELLQRML
jgi:hypothetical protein